MNKQQRKELGDEMDKLNSVYQQLEELADDLDDDEPAGTATDYVQQIPHMISALEGVQSNVSDQHSDEEGKLDNMPEVWKDGEKGDTAREIIDYLNTANDELQEAIDTLSAKRSEPYADLADEFRKVMSHVEEAVDAIDSAICT